MQFTITDMHRCNGGGHLHLHYTHDEQAHQLTLVDSDLTGEIVFVGDVTDNAVLVYTRTAWALVGATDDDARAAAVVGYTVEV